MTDRHLEAVSVRCLRCRRLATLTVVEHRYVRRWSELLDRRFDPAVSHTASCAACGSTYPVRRSDVALIATRQRRDALDLPRARDWRRTEVQV